MMIRVPEDTDPAKFLARYQLAEADAQFVSLNGATWLRLSDDVKLTEPPVFDAKDPPAELKTQEDYAAEIAAIVMPLGRVDQLEELKDKILRLAGALPAERREDGGGSRDNRPLDHGKPGKGL